VRHFLLLEERNRERVRRKVEFVKERYKARDWAKSETISMICPTMSV